MTDNTQSVEKTQIEEVLVLIERDPMVKSPKWMFAHEVPVAQALFGDDHVEIIQRRIVNADVMTANSEHERMIRFYSLSKGKDVVRQVYPTARALARDSGLDFDAEAAKAPKLAESAVVDNEDGRVVRVLEDKTGVDQAAVAAATERTVNQARQRAAAEAAKASVKPKSVTVDEPVIEARAPLAPVARKPVVAKAAKPAKASAKKAR